MEKIKELITINKGKKPKIISPEPQNSFLPYVDIKAFEKNIIDNYTDGEKCLPCEDGDLLIVCDGSRSGLVGRAVKGFVGSTLARIDIDKSVLPEYIYHFIQGKYIQLNKSIKGTGTPHLNQELLKSFELYVPSLEDQHRIVTRIEELFSQLDSGVETLKKTKEQLKVYRQAVLKEAFEGIECYKPLIELSRKIFDGPFGSNLKSDDYVDCGIRVVRLENLKNGWFDDSKESYVTKQKYESICKHTVYPSDLLMSTFISDSVKICQLPNHIQYAVNKADCIGIRLKDKVIDRYILYYLMTKKVYEELSVIVHGATRPRVNTKQIKSISVPVCDYEEQLKIVKKIESRLSVCDSIEKTIDTALQEAEALRQSILKQAFEGGL